MTEGRTDRERRWRLPKPSEALVLAAAAAFSPATAWAANVAEAGRLTGLILWALAVWTFGLVVWVLLVSAGLERRGVTYTAFWLILFATLLGLVEFPPGTEVIGVSTILAIVGYSSYRARGVAAYRYLTEWSVILVALMPVGLLVSSRVLLGGSVVDRPESFSVSSAQSTPDVVLLVFDGHGSYDYLGEVYDPAADEMQAALEESGVSFVDSARSNYTQTGLSVSSLLQMDYPLLAGERVQQAEWNDLLSMIQGDNRLVESLHQLGYKVTIVESGWSGASCGPAVDACVVGPLNTQLVDRLFERSVLGVYGLLPRQAFGVGSLNTIQWLDVHLGEVLSDASHDFVMAHLMLPHPPYVVDGDCRYHEIDDPDRLSVGTPDMSEEELATRRSDYVEVARCAFGVMSRVANQIGDSNVLLAVGDHGPDSYGQMQLPIASWTDESMRERFDILLAYSGACDIGASSLVNLGRHLLACIQGTEPDLVEESFFISTPTPGERINTTEPLVEVFAAPGG